MGEERNRSPANSLGVDDRADSLPVLGGNYVRGGGGSGAPASEEGVRSSSGSARTGCWAREVQTADAVAKNNGAQGANVLHEVGKPSGPHGDLAGVERSALPTVSDGPATDLSIVALISIVDIRSPA